MSSEPLRSVGPPAGPLDASWREHAEALQERALPAGRVVLTGPAPYGVGGLGRHMLEIVQALERRGQPPVYVRDLSGDGHAKTSSGGPTLALLGAVAPLARFSPAGRMWIGSVRFDEQAARSLPEAEHLLAFNGTALAQFRASRRAGMRSRILVSANSHIRRVVRQHDLAYRQYPVDRPWASHLLRRNLKEYGRADRIHVASRYIWESFAEQGVPEEALSFFPLTPDPRYRPAAEALSTSTFDLVYVGSLMVHKGVPLLLDAFGRLPFTDMRLVLVGGWKTRSMRRLVEGAAARDRRIVVAPGDALPHLHAARLCVHPAYEDGFAYAPAEALACGVPVIVSEDTGMKELIDPGRNGLILPTGNVEALTQALEAAYRGEILGG